MLEIIKESYDETIEKFYIHFYDENKELRMGFPMENGVPAIKECAKENFATANKKADAGKWTKKIEKVSYTYKHLPYGRCACGAKFELYDRYMGACPCPNCGQWYNLFGQELDPPDTWDEGDEEDAIGW